ARQRSKPSPSPLQSCLTSASASSTELYRSLPILVASLPGVGSVSTTKHFSSEDLTIHQSATADVGIRVAMRTAASWNLKLAIKGNAPWLRSFNNREKPGKTCMAAPSPQPSHPIRTDTRQRAVIRPKAKLREPSPR